MNNEKILYTKMTPGTFQYTNDLTQEFDENTVHSRHKSFVTYIYNNKPKDSHFILRYLGATRGVIKVDENNIIRNIKIFNDVNCYDNNIDQVIEKYKGYKIIFVD